MDFPGQIIRTDSMVPVIENAVKAQRQHDVVDADIAMQDIGLVVRNLDSYTHVVSKDDISETSTTYLSRHSGSLAVALYYCVPYVKGWQALARFDEEHVGEAIQIEEPSRSLLCFESESAGHRLRQTHLRMK